MNQEEMNKVLAEFAGWQQSPNGILIDGWTAPDGVTVSFEPPDFFNESTGLSDLFKWVIPKLYEQGYYYELIQWNEGQHKGIINKRTVEWAVTFADAIAPNTTEALATACVKAIEAVERE